MDTCSKLSAASSVNAHLCHAKRPASPLYVLHGAPIFSVLLLCSGFVNVLFSSSAALSAASTDRTMCAE